MSKQNVITRPRFTLTPETIEETKQLLVKNGYEDTIYKYTNDDDVVVFRPLFWDDYQEVQAYMKENAETLTQEEIDRKICEKAIVWPGELLNPMLWDIQKAGLQSNLSKQVLARSGFLVPDLDQTAYLKVEPLVTLSLGSKPTPDVVAELKAKYNWNLHLVLCSGEYYVVRPINRAEWRAITSSEGADLSLMTAERTTVWSKEWPEPVDFSIRPAGVAYTIAEKATEFSGFDNRSTVESL